jgi:hypothetical protein
VGFGTAKQAGTQGFKDIYGIDFLLDPKVSKDLRCALLFFFRISSKGL